MTPSQAQTYALKLVELLRGTPTYLPTLPLAQHDAHGDAFAAISAQLTPLGLMATEGRLPYATFREQLAFASSPLVLHGQEGTVLIACLNHHRFSVDEWRDGLWHTLTLTPAEVLSHLPDAPDVHYLAVVNAPNLYGKQQNPHNSKQGHTNPPTALARLLQLFKTEKQDIGYIYIYSLIIGLISLTLPLGVQAIIGLISGGLIVQSVWLLVGLVVLGVIATGGLQIMQLSVVEVIQQRIFARTALHLAERMPRLNLEALEGKYPPELMNRFFDVVNVQKGFSKLLMDLTLASLNVLLGLVLLSFYHPFFVFFGLALLFLLLLIFRFTGPQGLATSNEESYQKYNLAYWLQEVARALPAFKQAGARLPIAKTDRILNRYLHARKAHFSVLVRQQTAMVAFKTLITGGLLIMGSLLVVDRQINLGQFVASEIVILTIVSSVEKLIKSMDVVYDTLTAVEKLGYVSELPTEPMQSIVAPAGALAVEMHDLSYAYAHNRRKSLNHVSLAVAPGEVLGVCGPGGSGKSTLLRAAAGLLLAYNGTLLYNGLPLHDADLIALRARIDHNLAEGDLFEGTHLENITMGRPCTYEQVASALKALDLTNYIGALPEGLATHMNAGGLGLNDDLKNRLLLARLLAHSPDLYVLQEPFMGMGMPMAERLLKRMVNQHCTLILSTNNPDLLRQCTQVLLLEDGHVVAQGSFAQIEKHPVFTNCVIA